MNFRFFDEISEIFGIYQHFRDLSTIMADHGAHTERMCMGWDDDMRYLTLDCFFTYFEVCKTPVRSPETSKQQSYRLSKIPISRKKCIYPTKFKQKLQFRSDLQILTPQSSKMLSHTLGCPSRNIFCKREHSVVYHSWGLWIFMPFLS